MSYITSKVQTIFDLVAIPGPFGAAEPGICRIPTPRNMRKSAFIRLYTSEKHPRRPWTSVRLIAVAGARQRPLWAGSFRAPPGAPGYRSPERQCGVRYARFQRLV